MAGKSDTPKDQGKGAETTRGGKTGPTGHGPKGAGERNTAPGRGDSTRTGGQTERERQEQGPARETPRETRGAAAGGTEGSEHEPVPGAGDEDEDVDAGTDDDEEEEELR